MSGEVATRVTIVADGVSRAVLSAFDDKKGDVYLNLKPADQYEMKFYGQEADVCLEQRYSIHPSHDDPTGNLIKHTVTLEKRGPWSKNYHFTKAIKAGNQRFAPIFLRQFPNLTPSRYDVTQGKGAQICLGSFDQTRFQLYLMALASDHHATIPDTVVPDYNIRELPFATCKVTLVYSFLNLGAVDFGGLSHFQTFRQEEILELPHMQRQNAALIEGLSGSEVITEFVRNRQRLMLRTFGEMAQRQKNVKGWQLASTLNCCEFFRDPDPESKEYILHLLRLAEAGAILNPEGPGVEGD